MQFPGREEKVWERGGIRVSASLGVIVLLDVTHIAIKHVVCEETKLGGRSQHKQL